MRISPRPSCGTAVMVLLAFGCGAKTGIETPPPCDTVADCPPSADFCAAGVACLHGFCAVAEAPDCTDDSACTVDACDSRRAMCVHPIRDRDADTYLDGSCGGDDCDDLDPAIHPGASERCTGGIDEDCDGAFDCSDADCRDDPACVGCDPERCEGGLDEDCDAFVDCADTDCTCCEDRERICDDARDDDCDGDIDCLDADCRGAPSCCVPTSETCDGRDQDCDGVVDDGITCFFHDGVPVGGLSTTRCGSDWYAYDSPDEASAAPVPDLRLSSRVAIAFVASPSSCGGAAVAVIADQVRDGSGGSLRARFSTDRSGTGGVLVSDDASECSWDAASRTGTCGWRWQACCTDGVLIGPLGGEFCVTLTLEDPDGVSSVVVYDGETRTRASAFGVPIELCGITVPAAP